MNSEKEHMEKEKITKKNVLKKNIHKENIHKEDGTDKTKGKDNVCSAAYTYMVRCRDGSLYTGWTNNLEKRVKAHNAGKGAKYTRTRGPVELVYAEEHGTKQEAMSREGKIKHLSKKEKEELVTMYQTGLQHLKDTESEKKADEKI